MAIESSDPRRRRAQLLPKSGIGVVPPWLVIAPADEPVIRLDVRLLDSVEIRRHDDSDDEALSDVILRCGDSDVVLHIADGPAAAARIVQDCAALTRGTAAERTPTATPLALENADRYGKLVIMSSTPDAEVSDTDAFAGHTYELTKPRMIIGRTDDNDIIITHRSISRVHARVTRDAGSGRYTITDLHAINGLCVNGERGIAHELASGDIVDLGHVRMRFMAPDEEDFWFEPERPVDPERFLFIGSDAVVRRGPHILVGARAFTVDEVAEYALQGANLPLGDGRLLQAAMTLLVAARTPSS